MKQRAFPLDTGDFITDFMAYTEAGLTPDIFRLWAGIALCAGALERRVWLRTGRLTAFANLYTFLVAPPGVGKFVIEEVRDLWLDATEPGTDKPAFRVAPNSVTKAALLDSLKESERSELRPQGLVTDAAMLVAAEEFGVLLPAYDTEFIGVLNYIYNCPKEHVERRRTGQVKSLVIPRPQFNILAGCQPGWLATTFPEEAWSMGLTSRIIMVYASETPHKDIFYNPGDQATERAGLLSRLGALSRLWGEARWSAEAASMIAAWHDSRLDPVPNHSKLENYNRRRMLHLTKLALTSAVSRTQRLVVEAQDVERAKRWLFEAEALMPDIFRAMVGRSDVSVLEELHRFGFDVWTRQKKEPIHERLLLTFLAARVPSEKVLRLFDVAQRGEYFARVAGTECFYVPKARLGGVVE